MKAIFCDIDGVLNHQHDKDGDWTPAERFGLSPDLVANLKTVMDSVPDAALVISSSWRRFSDGMDLSGEPGDWCARLAGLLNSARDRICSAPTLHEFGPPNVSGAKGRAHDILLWLSEHGAGDPYVVIDDECKELTKWCGGHVVDCADDLPHGLTAERAKRAIAVLQAGHAVQKPAGGGGC